MTWIEDNIEPSTEVWTPCYSDDSARKAGFENRDKQAEAWCKQQDVGNGAYVAQAAWPFCDKDCAWKDCGNDTFALKCIIQSAGMAKFQDEHGGEFTDFVVGSGITALDIMGTGGELRDAGIGLDDAKDAFTNDATPVNIDDMLSTYTGLDIDFGFEDDKPPGEVNNQTADHIETWTPCYQNSDSADGSRDTLISAWCAQQGGLWKTGDTFKQCQTGIGGFEQRFKGLCKVPIENWKGATVEGLQRQTNQSSKVNSAGVQTPLQVNSVSALCPPPDCYQQCALQDKERRKACVLINKAHAEKMKAIGCPTSCTTKAVGKTCRRKRNPKKCPKKKK